MPFLKIIILLLVSFNFLFERILDRLNLSKLDPELPSQAKGIYDQEKYRRSQEYYRANHRFSQFSSSFSFVLIMTVLLFNGFGMLDTFLRQYTENPVWLAILFFACIGLANELMMLPFSVYHTFVIEEKFGFNKTTAALFVKDRIKSYLLAMILGGLILAFLVYIYTITASWFWILAWTVMSLLMLLMSMFYTSLLLPLFNKLKPLAEGELRDAIQKYCADNGFALSNIYIMDGSKRSSKANAFFSGLGSRKKIVLYDTLISQHTTEELVSILAHETGHYKLKHTRSGLLFGIAQTGFMFYLLSVFLGNEELAAAMGATKSSFHIDLISFGILYTPVSMLLGIVSNMISRKHEFQADNFAKTTYSGKYLIDALKKLSADNLSNLVPHPAYVFVHYSHPPLLKRLEALNAGDKSA